VRERFADWAARTGRAPEDVAHGFIRIAVQQMANAIKKISVARGYDITAYTLQCFGGAGGQHACLVADALGMQRVFVHPLAGVLSAYGMGLADQSVIREQALEVPLDAPSWPAVEDALALLAARAQEELQAQGTGSQPQAPAVLRRMHVRYAGSDTALAVPFGSPAEVRTAFEAAYRQRFAFLMAGRAMVVEAVSVEAIAPGEAPAERLHALHPPREVPRRETVRVYTEDPDGGVRWHDAALVVRGDMRPGDVLQGPATQGANAFNIRGFNTGTAT
ncbi:5-oxoprolinase, partial [Corallococcus coralloides]|nr:5-oxoprolinase [Corallococcus coralloides]